MKGSKGRGAREEKRVFQRLLDGGVYIVRITILDHSLGDGRADSGKGWGYWDMRMDRKGGVEARGVGN